MWGGGQKITCNATSTLDDNIVYPATLQSKGNIKPEMQEERLVMFLPRGSDLYLWEWLHCLPVCVGKSLALQCLGCMLFMCYLHHNAAYTSI